LTGQCQHRGKVTVIKSIPRGHFLFTSLDTYCRMYCLATMHSVTDRQIEDDNVMPIGDRIGIF